MHLCPNEAFHEVSYLIPELDTSCDSKLDGHLCEVIGLLIARLASMIIDCISLWMSLFLKLQDDWGHFIRFSSILLILSKVAIYFFALDSWRLLGACTVSLLFCGEIFVSKWSIPCMSHLLRLSFWIDIFSIRLVLCANWVRISPKLQGGKTKRNR